MEKMSEWPKRVVPYDLANELYKASLSYILDDSAERWQRLVAALDSYKLEVKVDE